MAPAAVRRERRLSAGEIDLWRQMVADIEPLDKIAPSSPAVEAPPPAAQVEGKVGPVTDTRLLRPPRAGTPRVPSSANLDRRSWQRLQRGQFPLGGRLDLHGMTQAQAHTALTVFILHASECGARCVLVITGQGLRSGGTLRALTPRWLAEPPLAERVLAFSPARLAHGGGGALYVLLRRKR